MRLCVANSYSCGNGCLKKSIAVRYPYPYQCLFRMLWRFAERFGGSKAGIALLQFNDSLDESPRRPRGSRLSLSAR